MQFYKLTAEQVADKIGATADAAWPWLPIAPYVNNGGPLGDCGIDFFTPRSFTLEPHESEIVDTYVGMIIPVGVGVLLWPRGGDKHLLGSGVIDTGYSGTVKFRVVNPYDVPMLFKRGDSIGQAVPYLKAFPDGITLEEVAHGRTNTDRGDSGRINSVAA